MLESQQFKAENYRGALQEYLQKDKLFVSYEMHRISGTDKIYG